VELKNGQSLNKEQVQAISHLVSSAVEGLTPANLTIVDVNGNVLANGDQTQNGQNVAMTATQLETQQSYERNLESRIQTMLSNVLGPDKAVVR
jgi:flagellar M-ring protein FliF